MKASTCRRRDLANEDLSPNTMLLLRSKIFLFVFVCLDLCLFKSDVVVAFSSIQIRVSSFVHRSNVLVYGTGADIEQPPVGEIEVVFGNTVPGSVGTSTSGDVIRSSTSPGKSPAALAARSKVNEIDFCIAPADVSLSRAYGITTTTTTTTETNIPSSTLTVGVGLSLTRALNDASNRAIRRILLARSWPSAEALNLSLRQIAIAESKREEQLRQQQQQQQQQQQVQQLNQDTNKGKDNDEIVESVPTAKCPVPRPILNVLTRQSSKQQTATPKARSRTDEEYVNDQIVSFRERYGSLVGYEYAEDYLASILSLATSGIESDRATKVLTAGYYSESYKRVLAVLRTVGVQFVITKDGKQQIASKLLDQDICLSMIDKIQLKQQKISKQQTPETESKENQDVSNIDNAKVQDPTKGNDGTDTKNTKRGLLFWKNQNNKNMNTDLGTDVDGSKITSDDLGGVLLSASEPTVTRQLNVLSNIIQRALLFGGDQELLVLAETLDADKPYFIKRWYPDSANDSERTNEIRPGVQYLNCLIQLLRNCYTDGSINDLNPPVPLSNSYANAYERLVASAVELGSGYMKPIITSTMGPPPSLLSSTSKSSTQSGSTKISSIPKPRTAQEGIGQFAVWESSARATAASMSSLSSSHPSDMEGSWEIRDEISGKTLGSSIIKLLENGVVEVPPPLEGLRWRLDPGPTHLDTCTFQVLSIDGTVLQYRGFIDRGARLEARFSKRPIKVRGSVMFQMRDGAVGVDYYRDMLPINYRQGTTKFVMTKQQTKT